jgi:hypothetical protein
MGSSMSRCTSLNNEYPSSPVFFTDTRMTSVTS